MLELLNLTEQKFYYSCKLPIVIKFHQFVCICVCAYVSVVCVMVSLSHGQYSFKS